VNYADAKRIAQEARAHVRDLKDQLARVRTSYKSQPEVREYMVQSLTSEIGVAEARARHLGEQERHFEQHERAQRERAGGFDLHRWAPGYR